MTVFFPQWKSIFDKILLSGQWQWILWKPFSFIFLDNSQQLLVETVHFSTGTYFFSQSFIPASSLSTGNSIILFQVLSSSGNYYSRHKGIQFLKTTCIPASKQQFYNILEIFRFFKMKATFPFCGNVFFSKSLIWLQQVLSSCQWRRIFCLVEAVLFNQSNFSASGSHYWNQGENSFQRKSVASGQLIFWQVETIFSLFFKES